MDEKDRKNGLMELSEILKCVEDEPELPGDPPEEIKAVLLVAIIKNDNDFLAECLRSVVRLTKQGITERITKAFEGTVAPKN